MKPNVPSGQPEAGNTYTPGYAGCKLAMAVAGAVVFIAGIVQLWTPIRLSVVGGHATAEAMVAVKAKEGIADVILRTDAEIQAQREPRDRSYTFWNEFAFKTPNGDSIEVRADVGSHVEPIYPLIDADGLPTSIPVCYDRHDPKEAVFPLLIGTWLSGGVLVVCGLACAIIGAVLRYWANKPIEQPHDPFTLLVAVVLSAQATDAGVNKATPGLFALADTPEKMLALGEERIVELIRTIGLFRTKAKNLIALSRILVERHGGEVPRDRAALEALPGVGRKTANVVLNVAFGEPTIAVDTHIFRVANRTGLAPGKTPLAVEAGLEAITPAQYKRYAHHWLILHGRYVCQARKPDCPNCVLADLCRYGAKTGPAELIAARAGTGEPKALSEPATEPTGAKAVRQRGRRPAAKPKVRSPRVRSPRPA